MWRSFTFTDVLLIIAGAALVYFRNWQAIVFLVLVFAYVLLRYYKSRKSNEFVIDKDEMQYTAQLDVGLDYRPMPNHFRTYYLFDTCQSESLYGYRLEGTNVLCRLIEDQAEDIDVPKHHDVHDGVVLESEIRKRDAERPFHITDVEEKIADLKKNTEWHKMDALSWHGLKYFIISKKLPQADARRYLRQELERLKAGEAAFFKEAEKYGLERDDNSLERLKVSEEKAKPSSEEYRKLYATESLGITDVEFSWGKKLTGVLEKLLGD